MEMVSPLVEQIVDYKVVLQHLLLLFPVDYMPVEVVMEEVVLMVLLLVVRVKTYLALIVLVAAAVVHHHLLVVEVMVGIMPQLVATVVVAEPTLPVAVVAVLLGLVMEVLEQRLVETVETGV